MEGTPALKASELKALLDLKDREDEADYPVLGAQTASRHVYKEIVLPVYERRASSVERL